MPREDRRPVEPSWLTCARMARSLRGAEHGPAVIGAVRPRGAGLFRDRGPVTLQLRVAALDHRLVRQHVDGFAVLERPRLGPGADAGPARSSLHAVLRWCDRRWSLMQFAPAVLGLLTAVLTALASGPLLVVAVVLLAAMAWLLVVMTVPLLRDLVVGHRRTDQTVELDALWGQHWTLALFHQAHDRRVDELFGQIRDRLHRLVDVEVTQRGVDLGGTPKGSVRLTERLVCIHRAVSTDGARTYLESLTGRVDRPAGADPLFTMMMFDARPEDAPRTPLAPVPFVRFYVLASLAAGLGVAYLLMQAERDACSGPCGQALVTYDRALLWMAYALVFRDAPGLAPGSTFAAVLAVPLALVLPTAVAVIAVGSVLRFRHRQRVQSMTAGRYRQGWSRVLIVTVADDEHEAVLDAVEDYTGAPVADPRFDGQVPVTELGTINDTELFLVQATQGTNAPSGVATTTGAVIRQVNPHYALIVGMCYGLCPDWQSVGDVLVSDRTIDLDHAMVSEVDGETVRHELGQNVAPGPLLLPVCRMAARNWTRTSGVRVWSGPMLAWNTLVDARATVAELRRRFPKAIGGEMEGAAFHAATRAPGVESILIKAISDWAEDRDGVCDRVLATRNSAGFVLHLVRTGALKHTPAARRA